MAKLTLTDLASLTNETSALTAINNNNAAVEAALENTLSRDGTSPNSMAAPLDMNSNRILNLPAATTVNEPLRFSDLTSAQTAFNTITLEAKNWANYTGGTVDGAEYSAKYYSQQAALSASDFPVITDSSTARTLSSADSGQLIRFTSNSAVTVTLPNNMPVNKCFVLGQAGNGPVTVSAAAGATLLGSPQLPAATVVINTQIAVTCISNAGGASAVYLLVGVSDAESVAAALALRSVVVPVIQTGTTYTVQATDNGSWLVFTNAGAITVTVPNTLVQGFNCVVSQDDGAGQITFTGGATLKNEFSQFKTSAAFADVSLRCRSNSNGTSAIVWVAGRTV